MLRQQDLAAAEMLCSRRGVLRRGLLHAGPRGGVHGRGRLSSRSPVRRGMLLPGGGVQERHVLQAGSSVPRCHGRAVLRGRTVHGERHVLSSGAVHGDTGLLPAGASRMQGEGVAAVRTGLRPRTVHPGTMLPARLHMCGRSLLPARRVLRGQHAVPPGKALRQGQVLRTGAASAIRPHHGITSLFMKPYGGNVSVRPADR